MESAVDKDICGGTRTNQRAAVNQSKETTVVTKVSEGAGAEVDNILSL